MRSLALISCICILGLASANAQERRRSHTFDIGAGFANSGWAAQRTQLSNGWNIGAGVGYNFSPYLGAKLDLGYSSMGISGSTLPLNIGVPGGDATRFHRHTSIRLFI